MTSGALVAAFVNQLDGAIESLKYSYEWDEDVHAWDEYSPGALKTLVLEECGEDMDKRRRYYYYVLSWIGTYIAAMEGSTATLIVGSSTGAASASRARSCLSK